MLLSRQTLNMHIVFIVKNRRSLSRISGLEVQMIMNGVTTVNRKNKGDI